MGKKYIDADEFRKENLFALDNAMRRAEKCGELKEAVYLYEKAVKSVLENIKYAPAANVRENVMGEWIERTYGQYECSVCGEKFCIPYIDNKNYCLSCGADMRGRE